LEFFVLEVTIGSAADLLGIQPNMVILYLAKNPPSHYLIFVAGKPQNV